MKSVQERKQEEGGEQQCVLDEAFLREVDRAMSARKRTDPYRLEEVCRTAQEESRIASLTDAYGIDRLSDRGRTRSD